LQFLRGNRKYSLTPGPAHLTFLLLSFLSNPSEAVLVLSRSLAVRARDIAARLVLPSLLLCFLLPRAADAQDGQRYGREADRSPQRPETRAAQAGGDRSQVLGLGPLKKLMEAAGRLWSNDRLGNCVLGLGDINRDDWPDIAVGAMQRERTLIYFGGPGILDNQADLLLMGGVNMVLGDFNGDGLRDLITHSQCFFSDPLGYRDTVYVYFGKRDGPRSIDTLPGLVLIQPEMRPRGSRLRYSFAAQMFMGDVNDDGFDDLVISSSGVLDSSLHSTGMLHIYFGRSRPRDTADYVGTAGIRYSMYAETLCMGDINGDNIEDLLVTSYAMETSTPTMDDDSVLIDVILGRKGLIPDVAHPDRRYRDTFFHGPTIGDFRQPSLIDANADGISDLFIAAGDSVYLYFGGPDLFHGVPDRIILKPASVYSGFSPFAYDIGDVTGDGHSDYVLRLVAGETLYLAVYPGNDRGIGFDRIGVAWKDFSLHSLGWRGACAPVGDVNGDGVNDFAAGASAGDWGVNDGYFAVYAGDTTMHPSGVGDGLSASIVPPHYSVFPNPFMSSMTVTVTVTSHQHSNVNVHIYDLLGRHIRKLFVGTVTMPALSVEWDGKDDFGFLVPSGTYMLSILADGIRHERLVVRMAR
jgi:hypothetical protein